MTVVLAVIGMELLLCGFSFLKDGWSCETGTKWKFAECAFPLLAAISLGLAVHCNHMALVMFLVAGCFKFGFPEILTHMHAAPCMTDPHKEGRHLWLSAFLWSRGRGEAV
jgi:hypothetical protein